MENPALEALDIGGVAVFADGDLKSLMDESVAVKQHVIKSCIEHHIQIATPSQ